MGNEYKNAITVLLNEYNQVCGRIFGKYFIKSKCTDEQRKSIEALEFMNNLMNGKLPDDNDFVKSDDYKVASELAQAINLLCNK